MSGPKITYLTAEYPAVSHTFILREVEALRALGLDVSTCSIRKTGSEHHRGPSEKDAAATTFNVLEAARDLKTLFGAQALAFQAPARYFGALWLALRMSAPGLRALIFQLIYFVEASILARHLQQQGTTHLHDHFASASATVAMLAAHMADIPFSFTLHGPSDLQDPQRWRLDEKIARASFVACISNFARSQAMLVSDPVHWPKLHIVHCGVIPETYAQDGKSKDDVVSLVFVGRLAPVKGLRILIEALGKVLEDNPNVHLTLIGDGPDRAWLEQAAQPFKAHVTITGYLSQDEVAARLAQSDVLVLPSFAEGVPVVLMEAMASGKPVIATQVAGVSELVENGVSGFIVPPGDVDSLVARLIELASDPDLRERMGQKGIAKVRDGFDVRKQAAILKRLFEDM